MGSVVLAISLGALCIALGEYVLYNAIIVLAGLLRRPSVAADFTPRIAVVIPVHNEEQYIRRKLDDILAWDYSANLFDVIVVDDGSTDRTADIVREFEGKPVKLLQTEGRKGKIHAQKLAFSQASAEFIAITDATVLSSPDALRKLVAHMADPTVGAVSARIAVRNRDANYLTRMSQFLFDIQNAQKTGEGRLDSAGGLFGQLSLIRRDAVGDFSTDVIYEDREFGISLRKHGYRARVEPGAVATYYAAESLGDFSRQKQRNVGAMTQSVLRHSDLLFNPRYGWYGLLIFPEYALFRLLRPFLLAFSFLAAMLYCIAFEPGSAVPLLASMMIAVVACYICGTAVLAPLVAEPGVFLPSIIMSAPGMALVAAYLAFGSLRYFRGDFDSKWERVKRDRGV